MASSRESDERTNVIGDPMRVRPVRLFTLSTCSHCKAAKRFLDDHGVDYEFTDVDLLTGKAKAEVVEEMKRYNPRLTFPTILIGDSVIVGNRQDEIAKELDL